MLEGWGQVEGEEVRAERGNPLGEEGEPVCGEGGEEGTFVRDALNASGCQFLAVPSGLAK